MCPKLKTCYERTGTPQSLKVLKYSGGPEPWGSRPHALYTPLTPILTLPPFFAVFFTVYSLAPVIKVLSRKSMSKCVAVAVYVGVTSASTVDSSAQVENPRVRGCVRVCPHPCPSVQRGPSTEHTNTGHGRRADAPHSCSSSTTMVPPPSTPRSASDLESSSSGSGISFSAPGGE